LELARAVAKQGRRRPENRNLPWREPFQFRQERIMHILYPHEVREPAERARLELDDDLTRRDAWMFAPLAAIVVALPLMLTALFAVSAYTVINQNEASNAAPPATFAMRWPEQTLPVIR
jgi:hypothetical protein